MKIVFGNYIDKICENVDKSSRLFVVCGPRLSDEVHKGLGAYNHVMFSDFTPNPDIKDAYKALDLYNEGAFDMIVAVGGGSSIDVAKLVKYKAGHGYFIAVPTTAGTGSECTSSAVIYENKVKNSIADKTMLPDYVIEDASFIKTLPDYHLKTTMLDALCQGIESYWSKSATEESRDYAAKCIKMVLQNVEGYLKREPLACEKMMEAAAFSGMAINITRTTLPHALSYGITINCGTSHGHSVAYVLPKVWKYMADKGLNSLDGLNDIFECKSTDEAIAKYNELYNSLELTDPDVHSQLDTIVKSVNMDRMNNNPVQMTLKDIEQMF